MGLALGAGGRSAKGRILSWLVSIIAPIILQRYASPERLEQIMTEVGRSWDRVKERVREGKA